MPTRVTIIGISLLISACAISNFSYRTIPLSSEFIASASRIEAKAPIRRYKDSFFNIELGRFQVENVNVGKSSKSKLSNKAEKTTSEDNSLWNFLIYQKVKFENVVYEQFRYEESKNFSFSLIRLGQETADAQCTISTLMLENNEVSRTSIGVWNDDSDDRTVQHFGEWLSTRLSCAISHQGKVLRFSKLDVVNSLSVFEVEQPDRQYLVEALPAVYTEEPRQAGVAGASAEQYPSDGPITAGLAVFRGDQQLAAASLVNGNNALWINQDTPESEQVVLVSMLYGLVLSSWLTQ